MSQSDKRDFEGRYFVVTGSTQGLGAAVAELLAARGAAGLVLCGRSRDKGQAQADRLTNMGCPSWFVPADLERAEDCQAIIDEAERRFGTLHGLANCAGMSDRGGILDTSPELFDRIFAVNVRAPFFLMQAAIKLMIRNQVEGCIVNIITMTSHGGQSFLTPYASSKGALTTLTKNVAYSGMRNRIRVNGLNIGWMDSPHEHEIQRQYHGADDDWLARVEQAQPFGRLLKPEEVARVLAFMLSDESGMMTGAIIDFDQGVIGCGDEGTPKPPAALALPEGGAA
ncbi:SDR family oxidoreductase [Zobellella iuensis]|uniref:SDR family oxidoreductase n=1 Tax=Zobellella iuensis TaxID=2803811 RepID=A0ABS1QT97_9GAMM|nr:SDR family oxidoreductase [Zobellella iuensis]MBL1378099.1 SDR family oxidoreductase [Zobellella iuensis]